MTMSNAIRPLNVIMFVSLILFSTTTWAVHGNYGVPEKETVIIDVPIRLHDGSTHRLKDLFAGKITALQLVFTRCSSICPIQASNFDTVQDTAIFKSGKFQLLSVSIDPEYDNPDHLAQWREKWGGDENWLVGASDFAHTYNLVAQLNETIGERTDEVTVYKANELPTTAQQSNSHHTAQVFFIGPNGKLLYRSFDFPQAETIQGLLSQMQEKLLPK